MLGGTGMMTALNIAYDQPRRWMPLVLQNRYDHTDAGQVVGIREEAHARDERDLPMLLRDLGVVHSRENVRLVDRCIRHHRSFP